MSDADVEVVRRQYAAWKRGDFEQALAAFDEDAVWDATHFPDGKVYRGHEGISEFMGRWVGAWDDYDLTIERFIDAGDGTVVILTRESGRAKSSGIEVEHRFGHVFTVRKGKVACWRGFLERDNALRAAGLDPAAS